MSSTEKITTYTEMVALIRKIGFLPYLGKGFALPSVQELTDNEWHDNNEETDPWKWRVRIAETNEIAYSKVFSKKSGFIHRDWIAEFLSVRRGEQTVDDFYETGSLSQAAKSIYALFSPRKILATHEIKALANFGSQDKTRFENGMNELMMKMYLTTRGLRLIIGANGEPHSWPSTAYSTMEDWYGSAIPKVDVHEAEEKIRERILQFNPQADAKQILKLIRP
ncbi:MAG: hypothetical protein CVU39_25155 [Chloroflexi bacterium HGW-Chloroflexi-10]|nr:MAG: hypothetical protein CVU39_25155 [Chloroflexi bacterium HGW-Chloroflexi-10]